MRNVKSKAHPSAANAENDRAADPQQSAEQAAASDVDRSFGVAIGRAFDILHCFTIDDRQLGISELGRRSGLPKATVARLTYTLEQLGYLYRSDPPGKYTLGWRLLSLGYPLLSGASLRQRARPPMVRLATELHANVNLATLDRLHLIYIETVRNDDSSKARSPDIGKSFPMLATASGRVLLAHLRGRRVEELANRLSVAEPQAWAAVAPRIPQYRDDLERKGFFSGLSEIHPDTWLVVVPLNVRDHEPPMVFNCSMPQSQYTRLQLEQVVGPMVVRMVREVEGNSATEP